MSAEAGTMTAKALDGITVVDLTRYLPGPYCTRLLADLGAEVIKVEPPDGDPMRTIVWYDLLNAGKQVITLDLRDRAAQGDLHALLARADVCVEGFRPSTAKAMGVDAATLRERYPHLVHCSISGYGQTGPDAERAGHDINYQAEAGLLAAASRVPPFLVADLTGALHAALRILAALVQRSTASPGSSAGRCGASLDVSLYAAASAWVHFVPPPLLRGDHACYNVYETADGQRVVLGALEPKFWARFCRHLGREDWIPLQFAGDPVRTEILRAVTDLFRTRTLDEWSAQLRPIDCCFSGVAITTT